jgi:hypothetical protein
MKMNSSLIIGMATMLTLTLVAAIATTAVTAFGQVDRNFHGQVTAGAAQELRESGSNFGTHASDPLGTAGDPNDVTCGDNPGRCGLSQAITVEHGSPQHPSDVIDFLCTNVGFAGCPQD